MKKHNLIEIYALGILMICNWNNVYSQATSAVGTNAPQSGSDYIGWTSGSNMDLNINNQDAFPIRFYTNNSERMRILGSGNTGYVGIATTSPSSVLQIDGNGTPSATGQVFRTSGPSGTDHQWRMFSDNSSFNTEKFNVTNPSGS